MRVDNGSHAAKLRSMSEFAKPCIVCGKELRNVWSDAENQPYEGTAFTTYGHYGSTIFDPMNGEYLEIIVCDDCLRKKAEEKVILSGRDKIPVMIQGSVIGYAKRKWGLVDWNPDLAPSGEVIKLEDWDDFQETREQWPIESRFSDSELKKMFS